MALRNGDVDILQALDVLGEAFGLDIMAQINKTRQAQNLRAQNLRGVIYVRLERLKETGYVSVREMPDPRADVTGFATRPAFSITRQGKRALDTHALAHFSGKGYLAT